MEVRRLELLTPCMPFPYFLFIDYFCRPNLVGSLALRFVGAVGLHKDSSALLTESLRNICRTMQRVILSSFAKPFKEFALFLTNQYSYRVPLHALLTEFCLT